MKHRIILPVALFSFTAAHAAVPVEPSRPTSPAKPAASTAAQSTAPLPVNAEYELRGFFGTGDMLEVSVSKKGAAASDWIPVGRKRGAMTVVSASPKDGTAVVLIGGKRSLLRLGSSKAGSEEVAAASEISDADLKDAHEYMAALEKNMTEEQLAVVFGEMEVQLRESLEKIKVQLDEDMERITARLGKGGEGINAELPDRKREAQSEADGARSRSRMAQAFVRAMELPGRDGLVHPVPRSLKRIFESPEALKRMMDPSSREDDSNAK